MANVATPSLRAAVETGEQLDANGWGDPVHTSFRERVLMPASGFAEGAARRGFVPDRAWVQVLREAVRPEARVVPQQLLANTTVLARCRAFRTTFAAQRVCRCLCAAVVGRLSFAAAKAFASTLLSLLLHGAASRRPPAHRSSLRCAFPQPPPRVQSAAASLPAAHG